MDYEELVGKVIEFDIVQDGFERGQIAVQIRNNRHVTHRTRLQKGGSTPVTYDAKARLRLPSPL